MSTQKYTEHKFTAESLKLIAIVNEIIADYVAQGYRLTVRQLYYQLVSRDVVENTQKSYKRVCSLVNDAKMAGLMDWEAIEDRTREFIRRTRWKSGSSIMRAAADSYHMDMWEGQEHRVFVIVEKEALAGVLDRVCSSLDIPLLAARGYPSGTVLREFTLSDLKPCLKAGQHPVILHLGDHDPSGIDMSRDLAERFFTFVKGWQTGSRLGSANFDRIALNMPQIEEQEPPPNPAKASDARFAQYQAEHGDESWELDALKPEYIDALVREHVENYRDLDMWQEREAEVERIRDKLTEVADKFDAGEL